MGGAICRHCGRPYVRHWWAFNLLPGLKLDRCDHCGRWGVARAQPLDRLRAAEAEELAQAEAGTLPAASPEERLRRQIEDSRYADE
jgi:hypothetical protein